MTEEKNVEKVINENIEKACFFTGHRSIGSDLNLKLLPEIVERMHNARGVDIFICGGAVGFDMEAAYAVLETKKKYPDISLWLFLPCLDQDKKWGEKDKKRYRYLLEHADYTDCPQTNYYDGVMKARNYKMVENAYYCVSYYNGKKLISGTAQTLRYAKKLGRHIFNFGIGGPLAVENL